MNIHTNMDVQALDIDSVAEKVKAYLEEHYPKAYDLDSSVFVNQLVPILVLAELGSIANQLVKQIIDEQFTDAPYQGGQK